MKKFISLLLAVVANMLLMHAWAQSCTGNLLTSSVGYYGGFEAGTSNFATATAATDYRYGMPPNGTYEIVNYASNAGGGGYLSLPPHSGNYQMLSHTRSVNQDRIWFKTVTVTPGSTYQFCAWIANAKTNPVNGFKINLNVNGVVIATKTAVYGWSQVCGTYTVPAGVTSILISITDPDAHTGPSHFLGLDDICFTKTSANTNNLGNLVWNDTDGDGKKDSNEPGISGITVSLYRDANSDNRADGAAIATTLTNAQGLYNFSGLNDGRYIVSIPVIAGYGLPPLANSNTLPDSDIDNDNNGVNLVNNNLYTNAITLMAGAEPVNDGDGSNGNLTLDLALCGNGFIGDFVWNDSNGNGIQDTGEIGIAGASVLLTFADGTTKTVVTDNNGKYTFVNLGPGTYQVKFNTPAGYVSSSANQGTDDAKDSDPINGIVAVTLAVNQSNLTIDAGFFTGAGQVTLGNLVWNDVNGDGIKEQNEAGVNGAIVKLYRDNDANNVVDGAAIATTTTNAQGYYTFTGLNDGKYIVGVIIPAGYTITGTSFASPDNNIDNDNNGVNVINSSELRTNFITLAAGTEPVNDGDDANGNLTLDLGICGRSGIGDFVWKDLNANGIQDSGEPGLAGVMVTLTYPDGTTSTTTSDANGFYTFINLGPGTHKLTFATPAGYNPSPAKQGTNTAKDSDPVNGMVSVLVLATTNNFTIDAGFYTGVLSLGNLVWNDTNGNGIKDQNEPGISGVTVKLYKDDNGDNIPDGSAIATTTTNTQGAYVFTGLSDGKYLVGVTILPGYIPVDFQNASNNPDNNIDNDNNAVKQMGAEVFTNAITLAAGSEPINDGDGANGNLTLDVALTGNSYVGDFVWNDLNGNGLQDVGEPGLADVAVSLLYADGTIKMVSTDANGLYYFSNMGPGNYTITFTTPLNFNPSPSGVGSDKLIDSDPVNGKVIVAVAANQNNLSVDAGFMQIASLSLGNLVWNDANSNGLKDASESGISGLTVNLYTDNNGDNIPDGAAIKTTTTNSNGNYLFANLPAGKYIAGVALSSGYSIGTNSSGSLSPDNDIDNDNNGVIAVANEVRSRYITLSAGAEPINDGDGNNSNLTLDFGLKASGSGCAGNLLTNASGYYGGFEAGTGNISTTTAGSDLSVGLPRNGSYAVVHSVSELGGGGYLDVQPLSGNYFLATHTSNRTSDRIWYSKVTVTPGATYSFCANTTLLKNLGNGARFIIGLYVNGVSIATGRVTFDWDQICGSYTVPAGVTSIELSIRDPKNGLFFAAIDNICFTQVGSAQGVIGDIVFDDLNRNGIRDNNEGGIANVTVTLTDVAGVIRTTVTNSNGQYQFSNLLAGTYTVAFVTPTGFTPTMADQGGDDTKDSDPVNGKVTVTLLQNQINNTIDAGFFRSVCGVVPGSICGTGYITKFTSLIGNGNFTSPVLSVAPGNTFTGSNNSINAFSYSFAGGQYKSQSDYRGTGYADQISGTENAHSLVNTGGSAYVATFSGQEPVNQLPFPGDIIKQVPAENSFMFWNGNQFAAQSSLVWEQNLTGLMIGKSYTFRFYVSNLMQPVSGTDDYNDPLLLVKFGGTSGLTDGAKVYPAIASNYQLTKTETANATALNGWKRIEVNFVADAPTKIIKIIDMANGSRGDVLGVTAIGLEVCEKDTDGDCVADIDDIDDDNDGIIDLDESNGYDPLQDCDNDGIANYKDQTPGCPGLIWMDCNNDGINDLFDFDRDGIINELDLDSDNDGILDVQETRDVSAVDNNNDGMVDGVDADGDGLLSTADADDLVFGGPGLTTEDLDMDGTPNYLDLDSDGDGVSDITEATEEFDFDGLANGTDTDGDGVRGDYSNGNKNADTYNGFGARGIILADRDGDGKPNAYDIDSDDDGITDNVEAQPTCGYSIPAGVDADGDGLDDAYDLYINNCSKKAAGITPFDKDGDAVPDMYDTDTDNDGSPDINEGSGLYGSFVVNVADTDGDGLADQFDIFNIKTATSNFTNNVVHSNMGSGGSLDGPLPAGSNNRLPQAAPGHCNAGADRDWRNISILPVTLINFTGKLNLGKTELTWKVASEQNISNYTIERSTNGQVFTALAKVNAMGTTALNTIYNYNDDVAGVTAATVYYRLKMIEADGTYKYSNVLSFKVTNKGTLSFGFYPNPANSYLQVKVNAQKDGMAALRIVDGFGKILFVTNTRVSAGANIISLHNISTLPAGMYNVQLLTEGQTLNQKLVIAR